MNNQIPVGYEVNQETWDWLKGTLPNEPPNTLRVWGELRASFESVLIRVNVECADGFHPIYAIQKEKD